jgi:hypothetical protein
MRTSSAAGDRASRTAVDLPLRVVLDLSGRRAELTRVEAVLLRDAAAAEAGRSSLARDLAVLLDHALETQRVLALRRNEAHLLARLARQHALGEVAARLADAA